VISKLILLIILGFVAALYFPESRQMMIDEAMPVLHPVLEWSAEREMEVLSRAVRRDARETFQLPQTRAWGTWLVANFTADAATDPWGETYSYQAWADSFAIRSDGPDGQRGSADDLRVAWHRPF
jgi:hypothetical protein